MGEAIGLGFDGFYQYGVLIAVDDAPPGGDGVDQAVVRGVEIIMCLL